MNGRVYLYVGAGENDAPHYLETPGTIRDIAQQGIVLQEGKTLLFYDIDGTEVRDEDNLLFEGTSHYDRDIGKWYARIDWNSFRHESDEEARL